MPLSSLYQKNTTKNYQIFLAKDLRDQCIEMNIKTKNDSKNTSNEYRYFLESNFAGVHLFKPR